MDPDRVSHADRAIAALSGRALAGDYAACWLWICSASFLRTPETWHASNQSVLLDGGCECAKLRESIRRFGLAIENFAFDHDPTDGWVLGILVLEMKMKMQNF